MNIGVWNNFKSCAVRNYITKFTILCFNYENPAGWWISFCNVQFKEFEFLYYVSVLFPPPPPWNLLFNVLRADVFAVHLLLKTLKWQVIQNTCVNHSSLTCWLAQRQLISHVCVLIILAYLNVPLQSKLSGLLMQYNLRKRVGAIKYFISPKPRQESF